MVQDSFKCAFLLFTRFMSCVFLQYQLSMQSVAFLGTTLVAGINAIHKMMPDQETESRRNVFKTMYNEKPEFRAYIDSEMREVKVP